MDAHETFKPIVALLAASLFGEGAYAEARYGVAAMVGKSAPTVATAITKAVENEGARWFRLDSSNTAIRRDMNERLLRAQADSSTRQISGLSAPKSTPDLPPTTSQPVPAIPVATAPLQGKVELEDEIRRVREMLAQSQAESPSVNEEANALEAQVAKAEPQPEPFVYPKLEDALAQQNPASNRLLAAMQETERRVVAARIRAVKDPSSTKKSKYGNLSNASGGTELHASLEFNRAIRGTTASQRGRSIRYASKRDDANAGYGGEPTQGAFGSVRGAQGTLGFTETPSRFAAFPRPSVPEAYLRRHKPEYQESGINPYEAAKSGGDGNSRKGPEVAGNGELLSRHKTNFQDSGINAYENKSSGAGGSGAPSVGADGSVVLTIPGLGGPPAK